MYILGISAFYHDSAACLVRDGRIVAAAQEERFTRKKHDHAFPAGAINYCLGEAGIGAGDVDLVAFYDKPFVKFERILETNLAFAPRGIKTFMKAMPLWLRQKLWIPDLIAGRLGYSGKTVFAEHHESHAASAFFPSPFDRAAFLTIDGVGEWATSSWGVGEGNRVRIMSELLFPHSLGLLYSAFTYFTGFKVNSGEYKLMGLAPYGEPRYVGEIYDHLIDLREDGSFMMNMEYFDYCAGLRMTGRGFERLFGGPPRRPEGPITKREMDLARSIQAVTEEAVLRMARHVKRQTGERYLCMAGGVALNCVANAKVLSSGIFEDIWIQPAAGDAGGAVGAALIAHHHYLDNPAPEKNARDDLFSGAYLGPSWGDDEISGFLEGNGLPFKRFETGELLDCVAGWLDEGRVIGWFQGRMEFGPRALGGRSIIGDPRRPEMQKRMNLKIKFRESFRPFAPSVLLEEAPHWFETSHESPYMLLVADVKEEKRIPPKPGDEGLSGLQRLETQRSAIPAVTHVDFSARLQTVSAAGNPLYYALIRKFYEKTGCPVIVNTSFNVRGEPIVASPLDAFRCFMRTGMDVLVMGNCVLLKEEQPEAAPLPNGMKSGCVVKEAGRHPEADPKTRAGFIEDIREDVRGLDLSGRGLRKFGLQTGVFLLLLAGASAFRGNARIAALLFAVGGLLAAAGLLLPAVLRRVYKAWMTAAFCLGWLVSRIILTGLFFLVITPVGLLARLMGRNFLDMDFPDAPAHEGPLSENEKYENENAAREGKTYWAAKEERKRKGNSYEKMY